MALQGRMGRILNPEEPWTGHCCRGDGVKRVVVGVFATSDKRKPVTAGPL
jgi:hypothetical protein